VTADAASKFVVRPDGQKPHSHLEVRTPNGLPANPDKSFFERIAAHMQVTHGTFLAGPGNIKFELKDYLDLHHPIVAARIRRIETLENITDDALVAEARGFFQTRGHRDMAEAS
jgi:hypothetical protein